jgi:hypothetical protein
MGIRRFIDAGRTAIAQRNLYAGLTLALILPDICGALAYPGVGVTKRYTDWCREWVQPKFTRGIHPIDGTPLILIRAEDVYQLRCSLLHQGTGEVALDRRTGIDRFLVFDHTTGAHLTVFWDCEVNGETANLIQLKADLFSEELFEAADEWNAASAGDVRIRSEQAELLVIRSKGARYGPLEF